MLLAGPPGSPALDNQLAQPVRRGPRTSSPLPSVTSEASPAGTKMTRRVVLARALRSDWRRNARLGGLAALLKGSYRSCAGSRRGNHTGSATATPSPSLTAGRAKTWQIPSGAVKIGSSTATSRAINGGDPSTEPTSSSARPTALDRLSAVCTLGVHCRLLRRCADHLPMPRRHLQRSHRRRRRRAARITARRATHARAGRPDLRPADLDDHSRTATGRSSQGRPRDASRRASASRPRRPCRCDQFPLPPAPNAR